MDANTLHIVSFDVPLPANYGGVIDVYYKINALSKQGIKIHLHCFKNRRPVATALEDLCEKVYYYPRNTVKSRLLHRAPYTVCSRDDLTLLTNILDHPAPVLLEGLHCTWHLIALHEANIPVAVRAHNVEHSYYRHLAAAEKNIFRKFYFSSEATKLEAWEPILNYAGLIAAISPSEYAEFSERYGNDKCHYTPAFHPFNSIESCVGLGTYALYHGNLSVPENHKAAMFLINEVFVSSNIPFIVAGHQPSRELQRAIASLPNGQLIADPDIATMATLQQGAHIHILPSFQQTGTKLKLLNALFRGRHVVVNSAMAGESALRELCHIAETNTDFRKTIESLISIPFVQEEIERRAVILNRDFSNEKNARELAAHLSAMK